MKAIHDPLKLFWYGVLTGFYQFCLFEPSSAVSRAMFWKSQVRSSQTCSRGQKSAVSPIDSLQSSAALSKKDRHAKHLRPLSGRTGQRLNQRYNLCVIMDNFDITGKLAVHSCILRIPNWRHFQLMPGNKENASSFVLFHFMHMIYMIASGM